MGKMPVVVGFLWSYEPADILVYVAQ